MEVSPQVAACATTKLFTTCAHFQFVWFLSISCYTCVDWTQYNSPIFSEWKNLVCQGFGHAIIKRPIKTLPATLNPIELGFDNQKKILVIKSFFSRFLLKKEIYLGKIE